jgi:hypothetical protein
MTYVGHLTVARALRRELPPIALLQGPRGVGKWTLTDHLAEHYTVNAVDRFDSAEPLTAEVARAAIAFVTTYPLGPFHLVRIRLDHASVSGLRALLKTLEEPPPSVRFLLTTSTPTLPTIISRAQVFRFGLLTADQVRDVLVQTGLTNAVATRAAQAAHGRVDLALAALADGEGARTTALTIMRAVARGERDLYQRATRGIDHDVRDVLLGWLSEAITGVFVSFTEEDTFGLAKDRQRLRQILTTLLHTASAHPRLSVRAALDPFLPYT